MRKWIEIFDLIFFDLV